MRVAPAFPYGDLDAVLRTLVPTGPVVLAGYSMGGMVAMAYARLYPAAIGARIVGMAPWAPWEPSL